MTQEEFNKIIISLKSDLRIYAEMMKEVSNDIIKEGFSTHPIFIASEQELKIGELLLDKNDYAANFHIYASTLEEMVSINLILESKKAAFIQNYKNPKTYMCVMLIANNAASIAFYPYQAKETLTNE
jgi:hypothetical protein